jgi:hypothetical protein
LQELINLAKDVRAARRRGQDEGLSQDEIAFYDALAENQSAVELMGNNSLKVIAHELLVRKIDVVADKGYFRTEDIVACEKAGLMPHVPKPQRGPAVASGFFRKDEFRYDAAQDVYICPGGHELKPIRQGQLRDMRKVDYANANACRDCPLRSRCTNTYRAVSRLEYEDALERMEERIAESPDILDRRREIVEHPFGTRLTAPMRPASSGSLRMMQISTFILSILSSTEARPIASSPMRRALDDACRLGIAACQAFLRDLGG